MAYVIGLDYGKNSVRCILVDGDAIGGWIIAKIAEKIGFLMRAMVEVRQKNREGESIGHKKRCFL